MVQTLGKQGKKVPIILTPDMQKSIETLLLFRKKCKIEPNNPYLFANIKLGPLDGWQVLQSGAKAAGCVKPSLITATRLRKYISTCAQVHYIYFLTYLSFS
jgi:hypothetical protein